MRNKKGIVTSDKQNKTVVVTVIAYKIHPKYKKRYQVSKKFYAHDEENSVKFGDTVIIEETKPLSKLKRWKVVQNLGSLQGVTKDDVPAPAKAKVAKK